MTPLPKIPIPPAPVQFEHRQFLIQDIEADQLIRVLRARNTYQVDGSGLTVAVLDTGLRTTHVDFAGKVIAQRNFIPDNNPNDASDRQGHGTHVAGIIVAKGIHTGIAPGANLVPLKVLSDTAGGDFEWVNTALQWILDNYQAYHITVVSMSLGDEGNYINDAEFQSTHTYQLIQQLYELHIPVIVAAGNAYFKHKQEGMSFPAIVAKTISVGAVYDSSVGSFTYASGAEAFSTGSDRITPFSQRLHQTTDPYSRTDIFAPGAPITSSGIASDRGESIQQGTSQATPVTTGIVLLLQEFHQKTTGTLPSVDLLTECLRSGAVVINDGNDEDDNVPHSEKDYLRIDAPSALDAMRRSLQKRLLTTQIAFR